MHLYCYFQLVKVDVAFLIIAVLGSVLAEYGREHNLDLTEFFLQELNQLVVLLLLLLRHLSRFLKLLDLLGKLVFFFAELDKSGFNLCDFFLGPTLRFYEVSCDF